MSNATVQPPIHVPSSRPNENSRVLFHRERIESFQTLTLLSVLRSSSDPLPSCFCGKQHEPDDAKILDFRSSCSRNRPGVSYLETAALRSPRSSVPCVRSSKERRVFDLRRLFFLLFFRAKKKEKDAKEDACASPFLPSHEGKRCLFGFLCARNEAKESAPVLRALLSFSFSKLLSRPMPFVSNPISFRFRSRFVSPFHEGTKRETFGTEDGKERMDR